MNRYKRIGILGGMSPESTADFYTLLIKKHFEKYQNYSYPEILIFSVNFERAIELQEKGDKKEYATELLKGITSLKNAGAEVITIASNTPHLVFSELEKKSKVPMLSIVRSTANFAKNKSLSKLLLLGTKFTMRSSFYKDDFTKVGIGIEIPTDPEISIINDIIYKELVLGIIRPESKSELIKIVNNHNVDGVILGCTELPLILKPEDSDKVLLDTLNIYADTVLDYADAS